MAQIAEPLTLGKGTDLYPPSDPVERYDFRYKAVYRTIR